MQRKGIERERERQRERKREGERDRERALYWHLHQPMPAFMLSFTGSPADLLLSKMKEEL